MMRALVALALLSVAWMWGLEYYTLPNGWLWSMAIVASVALVAEPPRRRPSPIDARIAAALALPALWILSWPYRAIPLGLVLGLLPFAVGPAPRFLSAAGWGAVRSAVILSGQAIAIQAYSLLTARLHDLPWPCPPLVAMIARLQGAEASADGAEVAIFSTSGPQRLAVTWQLVLDPVTPSLLAGAIVLVALWTWEDADPAESAGAGFPARRWLKQTGLVLLAIGLWMPFRLALLIGLFLHRQMRAPEELKSTVMNQFFSPWVLGAFSIGAVASLAFWMRRGKTENLSPTGQAGIPQAETVGRTQGPARPGGPAPAATLKRRVLAAILLSSLVGGATALLQIDPVGKPRGGRVVFVERHSHWEPSDRPYDTTSFGEDPSYSYTAIYDYCGQYFEMSRLQDDQKIDTAGLAACDVLVIKTPTEPYSADEIQAVLRFVARGGGLLLIGEHTDFMHSGEYLNAIAGRLGFKFRLDNLFGIDSPYDQYVWRPRLPHPAVRNVPLVRYANSCSIDPGWSWGRAAVWSTGLWGLGADYNMENYFPEAYYHPEMRYGAFIQLWETRHGKGRVLAFADSTIFSNFSTYEPGKAELMLDMLSWLNCRSPFDSAPLRLLLRASGWGLLALLVWLAATRYPLSGSVWLVWFACGLVGYTGTTHAIAAWQRGGLPDCRRPLVRVVLDRTVSRVPLSEGGFTRQPDGYGLLEQWIPRLGHYTVRAEGPEAFSGDLLLVLSPSQSVSQDYRRRLVDWVSRGGRLLVFDSPDNLQTTANSLLWPFGISVYHAYPAQGTLQAKDTAWPGISMPAACQVEGGEPFMWAGGAPVGTTTRFGQGTVTAIGFGSLLNNTNMGGMWTVQPGSKELLAYSVLFELINSAVERRPFRPAPAPPAADPKTDAAPAGRSETIGTIRTETQ